MRRMIAVALAALMVTVFATPAHAADGQHSTNWVSVAWDGTGPDILRKEAQARLWWDTQNDGTGVCVEYLALDTLDGGWLIEGYYDVRARWWYDVNNNTYGSWSWGQEPDDFTKNHGRICGPDAGAMDYRLRMCADDDVLWWRWRVWSSGNSDLIDKGHDEGGSCNGPDV